MNAFVRQLAVLSVLWAMCELLLPSGRQPLIRMSASVLVLSALLSTAGQWLKSPAGQPGLEALSGRTTQSFARSYQSMALTAAAGQTERLCEAMARRMGYGAKAEAVLRENGGMEEIRMTLWEEAPLVSVERLRKLLAQSLETEEDRVRLLWNGAEEP